jgi:hypothetical protein
MGLHYASLLFLCNNSHPGASGQIVMKVHSLYKTNFQLSPDADLIINDGNGGENFVDFSGFHKDSIDIGGGLNFIAKCGSQRIGNCRFSTSDRDGMRLSEAE